MKHPLYVGRDIHGVLLLDKPSGLSSNRALQKVKRLYQANRAGHTGTLDPLASGMLPICLGEATKFSRYLLDSDKSYQVIARLGQRTTTADAEGAVLSERKVTFTDEILEQSLHSFRGEIQQTPPMYSAIKFQGHKLYQYARQGFHVPRLSRRIIVHKLFCRSYNKHEIKLEMHVSKGTYIRTIIDDLGEKLGCGAHVIYLRRLQVAHYQIDQMITLKSLEKITDKACLAGINSQHWLDPLLMSTDSPVSSYPKIKLLPILAELFKKGRPVRVESSLVSGLVRVIEGNQDKFLGMAEITSDGIVFPRRLVSVGVHL
ncbi:tRNA pseudouridine(55) synthase TruB [Candidatus Erwinia haradaeae]|uniref:tRNA pseudouridine synthase B n=1 Tax=Candidatus Erwinia haradaeae TaxID=1922217 RepID=A0A451D8M9_9GAMM|nr:tRNA pseudouridine(55) synthase TruB [Candidatus Erwinia haradaeae]VFP82156.1 tRNA pseudouridine synthase B [Candidatus Erwinia haradaeae]